MPRGYWRFILAAFFGLATLSHAQPAGERSSGDDAAAKSDQGASEDADVSASARRIAGALEAQQRDADAGKADQEERERRDLQAQEEMADWGQAMFWAAATQALLSLIGIILIYITFKEARRAADSSDRMADEAVKATTAAIDASNAGREANEISRESIEKQIRPYLSLQDFFITNVTPGKTPSFKLTAKNTGGSGAFNIRCWMTLTVVTGFQRDTRITFADARLRSDGLMTPGDFINYHLKMSENWTDSHREDMLRGGLTVFFSGLIVYRDAFRKRRLTIFNTFTDYRHAQEGRFELRLATRGNNAS